MDVWFSMGSQKSFYQGSPAVRGRMAWVFCVPPFRRMAQVDVENGDVTLQQEVSVLCWHREKRQCQVQCLQRFLCMPGLQRDRTFGRRRGAGQCPMLPVLLIDGDSCTSAFGWC